MTTQAPETFGRDIYCGPATEDADAVFSEVDGVQLVKQDLRHRLTTPSVLGPSGNGDGFFDVGSLLGSTAGTVASYQAKIKRVCLVDQRIASAAVIVTETAANGLVVTTITINCATALGPFRLAFRLDPSATTDSQVQIVEAQ